MTLAELIKRDSIEAHWFWTHEVSTGPYAEHEVWDVVFVRNTNEPDLWVTDGDTRRTAYFQGIDGCQADSRRETGGERREPDMTEVLRNLLMSAYDIDAHPTFKEWCESWANSCQPAWERLATYERQVRERDTLRAWLGDEYDEYVTAATADDE